MGEILNTVSDFRNNMPESMLGISCNQMEMTPDDDDIGKSSEKINEIVTDKLLEQASNAADAQRAGREIMDNNEQGKS